MSWEDLEKLYWRFDAMHKGYGECEGVPTSERDAFKRTVKQALAEKDAEIVRWKAAHDEMVSRNRLLRDRPDLPADRIRAHDEWVEKYQQLMKQAARFAEAYRNAHLSNWIDLVAADMAEQMAAKDPVYVEAQAFLKERE